MQTWNTLKSLAAKVFAYIPSERCTQLKTKTEEAVRSVMLASFPWEGFHNLGLLTHLLIIKY